MPNETATPTQTQWLRLGPAAERAGVSVETLKKWIRRALIVAARPSCRLTLVNVASLDAFLAKSRVENGAD